MSKSARGLSFEFFPPKNATSRQALFETHRLLNQEAPDFFSVTYGTGQSQDHETQRTVIDLQHISNNIAAHISFAHTSDDDIKQMLDLYEQQGVRRLVAILGDARSVLGNTPRHAIDMVRLIRTHSGDTFHISVAAYPETHPDATSYDDDLNFLKEKLDAGADQSITQFFYRYDAWQVFYEKCQALNITKPIIPGIMPISKRLPEIAKRCNAHVPQEVLDGLERYGENAEDLLQFNLSYLSALIEKLLKAGANGLHFYTMNQAQPSHAIWQQINHA